jgi:D-3-phosphoglycerate dehydrogenase
MLVIYNKDMPGTVGRIATTLGDDKINIARLFLGRDKKKGTAIIIINLDAEVPETVAEKIRKVSNTLSVQKVTI